MNPSRPDAWRASLSKRIGVCAIGLALWAGGISTRLVYLQVFRHEDLARRAERQQMRTIEAPAKRADIVDRNGRLLAYSVEADTIYAVPTDISDPDTAARRLCGALGDCESKAQTALADRIRKGKAFVYVRRQVTPEQARRVADLDLEGVGFLKENRRYYPNKTLAAQVLGYVGVDNVGLAGIESAYDSTIKGRPGTVLIHVDAKRRAFSRTERKPTSGATLELTIDQQVQYIVERELKAGVEWSGAAGASAVVMDPFTGELLAVASYPTFNPNVFRQATEAGRRNRAVQDLFEPGSTFKIITASAALEEGVVRPTDVIDVSPGYVRFGSRTIRDDHHFGALTFEDVVAHSSNVGAIRTGLKLGRAALRPLRAGVRIRRGLVAGLQGRESRHRLGRRRHEGQRPGVDAHRLSGRRHAAADGRCRQCGGQWRGTAAATRRARRHARRRAIGGAPESGAPCDQQQHRG